MANSPSLLSRVCPFSKGASNEPVRIASVQYNAHTVRVHKVVHNLWEIVLNVRTVNTVQIRVLCSAFAGHAKPTRYFDGLAGQGVKTRPPPTRKANNHRSRNKQGRRSTTPFIIATTTTTPEPTSTLLSSASVSRVEK